MSVEQALDSEIEQNFFEYLRQTLDDVCVKLAEKFNLFTAQGKPRKAFILDTLIKYSCHGCIVKVFTQQRKDDRADRLFLENHRLAVGLLVESLRRHLREDFKVEEEVKGEYGRPDIIVKPTRTGVILKIANMLEIIIEVKTGEGFTYSQLFRYLVEKPDAILFVWRVAKHQIIRIDGKRCRNLLLLVMEAALERGLTILEDEYGECDHTPVRNSPYVIEDAQAMVDDFLTAMVDTLPVIVESVLNAIRSYLTVTENKVSPSATRDGGGRIEV